ncbi:MAG TPA: Hsp20/alpha crystallin family protein [Gemmatimonadaceae bacterium]
MPRESIRQTRAQNSEPARSAPSSRTASGRPTQNQTADRERRIETGRESARDASRGTSPQDARDRVPAIYQYASGLTSSPFTIVRRMAEDMDRILQDFGFSQSAAPTPGSPSRELARDAWRQQASRFGWSPQLETFRRGDRLFVRADLPGLKKDDVKVEVEGDVLAISGERRDEREESRDDYFRSERSYGRFYRAVPLPENVSADQIEASFKDGVLEVSFPLPKESASGRRQVQIR